MLTGFVMMVGFSQKTLVPAWCPGVLSKRPPDDMKERAESADMTHLLLREGTGDVHDVENARPTSGEHG
ncbi:hypothetical protein VP1G_11112 [Cytospora mali]|uniref:Uncharacterized protein n=1 Tax=Cytospora mali TaxID=578113 RepID=A0A194V4G1_CYTMA|nr:hypothetical protein VP1G_11112 [Valsa mali var. pyri (nom. inval.)]